MSGSDAKGDADMPDGDDTRARRLETRTEEEPAPLFELAGEEPPESATGFYLALGIIVASLLLVLTWLSGSSRDAADMALNRRLAPAPVARPLPRSWRAPPIVPRSRTASEPLSSGEVARGRAAPPGRPASGSGLSPAGGSGPKEPGESSAARPSREETASTFSRAGGSPPNGAPLPSPVPPVLTMPPLLGGDRGAPPPGAPGSARAGFRPLPGAVAGVGTRPPGGYTDKLRNSRLLYPPPAFPSTPTLPDR
jgi:hypothetical protein